METKSSDSIKQDNFLRNHPYLKSLLIYSNQPNPNTDISLQEYFMRLHRIIFGYSGNSDIEIVNVVENIFCILIENSIRIDDKTIIYKSLSYFIKNGFNLFISTLKSKNTITKEAFNEQLLNLLDSKEMAKFFKLEEVDFENTLHFNEFKKVIGKIKFKFINKLVCYVLLFFRKFVEEKDKSIAEAIYKYLNDKKINRFYLLFDEEINKKNDEDKIKAKETKENSQNENVEKDEAKQKEEDFTKKEK